MRIDIESHIHVDLDTNVYYFKYYIQRNEFEVCK